MKIDGKEVLLMLEELNLDDFKLVPADYKRRDPRQLAYNFADTIRNTENGLVIYNKYVQQFIYYHSLDVAENIVRVSNQILVPSKCLHWRRTKDFNNRRVMIGRQAFYAVYLSELSEREKRKLLDYIEEKRESLL